MPLNKIQLIELNELVKIVKITLASFGLFRVSSMIRSYMKETS